jgi:putative membrane protein
MAQGFARRHVGSLAAVLAVVSIGIVVAAVRGVVPSSALPHAPQWFLDAIPTLNAVISATAIGTILYGVRRIRAGDVDSHRKAMLATTGLFAAFLGLYLYRIVVEGTTEFPTDGPVYTFVYLPILGIHMALAMLSIPLVYYVLLLAGTRPVSEIPRTRHAKVGRVAASLWLVSFALGIVVYLMLYVIF